MAVPTRGVNNIRTLSGRVDQVALPYRAYMQVACLEMEKARRNKERQSASQRIASIDSRIAEIEKMKVELMRFVGAPGSAPPKRLPGLEVKPEPRRSGGGFKIRY